MTEKTKLDIALLLPAVPDARDACVRRLGDILTAKKGIDTAHLVDTSLDGVNQICIHFDPDQLSIGEVRELAIRAGAELDQQFGHLLLNSQTMYARQASSFEARAKEIPGILDAAVSPTGLLKIEFDRKVTNEDSIRVALRKIGVPLTDAPVAAVEGDRPETKPKTPAEAHEHEHEHGGWLGEQAELLFAGICGILLVTGWLVSTLASTSPWVPWSLYLAAYVFGGYFTFREALENVLARRFKIDFLMLVAALVR